MTDTSNKTGTRHTPRVPPVTESASPLLKRFGAIADEHALAPACLWDDHAITYQDLDHSSSVLATSMLQLSGSTPSPVALFLDRCCEVLIACMAAAKAGLAYVPINMSWPEERIRKALARVGAKVVVISPTTPPPTRLTTGLSTLELDARTAFGEKHTPAFTPILPPTSDSPLYILFTSGSTGEPKGVVVTHGNVMQLVTSPRCPGFEPGKRVTSCCATAFDLSVAETWGSMLNGCTVVCAPKETYLDSRLCLQFFQRYGLNYGVLPTAVFHALASQDAAMFGSLEKLLICGELPNSSLCKEVRDTAPPRAFFNTYGPTECTVFVTAEEIGDIGSGSVIPAGHPLPTAYIRIVDEKNILLPPGQWGEVLLGGAGVAAGYFNDPEKTAAAFVADPDDPAVTVYRSGDRGKISPDGKLIVSGRFDDQVKISGTRVELGEIKTLLNAAPRVLLSHVVYNAQYGLIAYAVLDRRHPQQGEGDDRTALREFLEKLLPAPMVPRFIQFMPAFPLNSNGKVDSKRLPQPPFQRQTTQDEDNTSDVLHAFRGALHDNAFTAEDSFLACGGNSLVAASLIGTLYRLTGVWVPLELFSNPQTAQLVQMFISTVKPETAVLSQDLAHEQARF